MAEAVRDVRIRVTIDSERVAEGAQRATTALDGLGSAAAEVGPKLKAPFEGVGVEAEQLATEVKQLEVFLKRIEGASSGPLILQRNAELARAAFQVLNEQAQRLGVTLPAAIGERVATSIQTATTQAARMNAELEKMGGQTPTKLDKVISALGQTEQQAREAAAVLKQLGTEGEAVAKALLRMADAKDSPRQLGTAVGVAKFQFEEMRKSIDAAARAGKTIGPEVAAAMKQAEAATAAMTTRAGQLRDAVQDSAASANLAGDRFQTLHGSVGSLDAMFARMRDTGSGFTRVLGGIGGAASLAAVGIQSAISTGRELGNLIDWLAKKQDDKARRDQDAALKAQLLANAERLVTQGRIERGKSDEQTIQNLVKYEAAQGRLTEQVREFIKTLGTLKVPETFDELKKKTEDTLTVLEGQLKKNTAESKAWLAENAPVLKEMGDKWAEFGKRPPAALEAMIQKAKEAAAATRLLSDEGAKAAIDAAAKIVAAKKQEEKAFQDAMVTATQTANEKRKALDEETLSAEEYSKRKQAIYEEETKAVFDAIKKQDEAKKQSQESDKALQESLGLSKEAFDGVQGAAASYQAAIEKGASPTQAMANAIQSLQEFVEKTEGGIRKFGEAVVTAAPQVDQGATAVKELGGAAGIAAQHLATLKQQMDQAAESATRLALATREAAAAAREAAGNAPRGGPQ